MDGRVSGRVIADGVHVPDLCSGHMLGEAQGQIVGERGGIIGQELAGAHEEPPVHDKQMAGLVAGKDMHLCGQSRHRQQPGGELSSMMTQ